MKWNKFPDVLPLGPGYKLVVVDYGDEIYGIKMSSWNIQKGWGVVHETKDTIFVIFWMDLPEFPQEELEKLKTDEN